MFQNLKADIIYYKTPTDFELEFNLCGCCRMRLLSDKMQDKKSFVHSLARDVTRSNVILVAGPLFGDEGTIKIIANAINTTTEIADNKTYGISSDQEIEILKDSTPLVTTEGYFGGCIIESGPQTLIILTDNKNIRKSIMQNLIHPYISELSSNEEKPQNKNTDIVNQQETEEPENTDEVILLEETENVQPSGELELIIDDGAEEDTFEEDIDVESETVPNETESQNSLILNNDDDEEEDDFQMEEENIDLFFEPTKPKHRNIEIFPKRYDYISNYDEYDDAQEFYKPEAPRKNILSTSVLIISIILLLVVAILCFCIFFVPAKSDISPVANLQEIWNTMFG